MYARDYIYCYFVTTLYAALPEEGPHSAEETKSDAYNILYTRPTCTTVFTAGGTRSPTPVFFSSVDISLYLFQFDLTDLSHFETRLKKIMAHS